MAMSARPTRASGRRSNLPKAPLRGRLATGWMSGVMAFVIPVLVFGQGDDAAGRLRKAHLPAHGEMAQPREALFVIGVPCKRRHGAHGRVALGRARLQRVDAGGKLLAFL